MDPVYGEQRLVQSSTSFNSGLNSAMFKKNGTGVFGGTCPW